MSRRPFTRALTPVLAALLACTVACSGTTDTADPPKTTSAADTTTTTLALPDPTFVEAPCTIDVPPERPTRCGTVTVPEDRTKPEGRQVTLAVAIVSTTAPDPEPDPVVYLHGGPGSGRLARGLSQVGSNPFLANRDLIYFDQRGVGLSTPSLNCPERETAFIEVLSAPKPATEEIESIADALATCHDRLEAEGIDLSQYNTVTNAQDLDAIRRALGYEFWNLWGISYGTRLALEAMRSQPAGIRSVVIDSVYPPGAGAADDAVSSGERAFDALANGCATDPACNAKNPDVRATLERAAAQLDTTPYEFDFVTGKGGPTYSLALTGNDLVGGIFNALYDTLLIPLLPSAITALANGDRSIVPIIAQDGIPFVNDATEGAFLSYECADNGARLDDEKVAELRRDPGRTGLLMATTWQPYCGEWPVRHLPDSFGDTVRSTIPTLVIAGEYDPITPPAGSRATADALENSVFIQVPHGGHGPGRDDPCASAIMGAFVDELTAVDTSCVGTIVPAPFT